MALRLNGPKSSSQQRKRNHSYHDGYYQQRQRLQLKLCPFAARACSVKKGKKYNQYDNQIEASKHNAFPRGQLELCSQQAATATKFTYKF